MLPVRWTRDILTVTLAALASATDLHVRRRAIPQYANLGAL